MPQQKKKDVFYGVPERTSDDLPTYDVKIVMGDLNAKIGREDMFKPTIDKHSKYGITNGNDMRVKDFAMRRGMSVRSTCFAHKEILKET
jgi:hypothetical protein